MPHKLAAALAEKKEREDSANSQSMQSTENRLQQIKAAVAAGQPVVFELWIYESFLSKEVAKSGKVPIPDKKREVRWGPFTEPALPHGDMEPLSAFGRAHPMLIIGYNDDTREFDVLNNWGKEWGRDGFCLVPYAMFEDDDLVANVFEFSGPLKPKN